MTHQCPVCAAPDAAALDAPLDVPVLMNRAYDTPQEARAAASGPLHLAGCGHCGFVWNLAFRGDLIDYDAAYENDQAHSPAFASHLAERAREVVAAIPAPARLDYLEVGCGQGRFIEAIARQAGPRLGSAEGFDPAWRGADGRGPAGSRIHKVYFDAASFRRLARPPNVIATRHTIEHVPDPVAFLTAVRAALPAGLRAEVFVETPCVAWILERQAMQDFFYEHCSLFTAQALALALHRAGFAAPSVGHVFGGQYLWARASTGGAPGAPPPLKPAGLVGLQGQRERYVAHWRAEVRAAAALGPVALWGAGAKGVTFALLAGHGDARLDHVVDINPGKQGRYLAGTGLPILSPRAAVARGARTIFVMNPNYLEEIAAIAAEVGLAARLVPINEDRPGP